MAPADLDLLFFSKNRLRVLELVVDYDVNDFDYSDVEVSDDDSSTNSSEDSSGNTEDDTDDELNGTKGEDWNEVVVIAMIVLPVTFALAFILVYSRNIILDDMVTTFGDTVNFEIFESVKEWRMLPDKFGWKWITDVMYLILTFVLIFSLLLSTIFIMVFLGLILILCIFNK